MASSNDIAKKIRANEYPSIGIARAVVKRAQLDTKATNRLLQLIETQYTKQWVTLQTEIASEGIPKAENGSPFGGALSPQLETDLLKISVHILGLAVKHKLSREEIFDRLRNAMHWGIG